MTRILVSPEPSVQMRFSCLMETLKTVKPDQSWIVMESHMMWLTTILKLEDGCLKKLIPPNRKVDIIGWVVAVVPCRADTTTGRIRMIMHLNGFTILKGAPEKLLWMHPKQPKFVYYLEPVEQNLWNILVKIINKVISSNWQWPYARC